MRKLVLAGLLLGAGVLAAPAANAGQTVPPPAGGYRGPMPIANQPHGNWGNRINGRWWAGWQAPGGWNAYRRPVRGFVLPRYWINPTYYMGDFGYYGLPAPAAGYGWSRYYDDAVLTNAYGMVIDARYNYDWDRFGGYDAGYADGFADGRSGDGYHPEQAHSSNGGALAGAVVGGVIGGVAGSAIAGSGNRTAGAIIGAGVGAVGGAAIGSASDKKHARQQAYAEGYAPPPAYDGRWEGTWSGPNGYNYNGVYQDGAYQSGHWSRSGVAPAPLPALPYAPLPAGGYSGASSYYYESTDIVAPIVTTEVTETTTYTNVVAARRKAAYRKHAYKPKPRVVCTCTCGCR